MKFYGQKLFAISTALALVPGMALALDAQDFATKLANSLNYDTGLGLSFADAQVDGDNVILTGVKVEGVAPKADQFLKGLTVTFVNVAETADNGYTADRAEFNDINISEDDAVVSVKDISATGIHIFADPGADILNSMQLYEGIFIGPASVSVDGEEMFRMESFTSVTRANEDRSVFEGDFAINGVHGAIDKIDKEEVTRGMAVLGLDSLDASMRGNYKWDVSSGDLSVNDLALRIESIGQLSLNMNLLGYTLDLVKQLQDMGRQSREMDPSSSEAEMAGMQIMMTMMSQLSLGGLSIRFDDLGVTDSFIGFVAQTSEASRKEVILGITQKLPEFLAILESEDLQAKALAEITRFLGHPGNIEVSARPEEPVPFMAMMAVAQNPSIAGSLLNLDIVANQDQ